MKGWDGTSIAWARFQLRQGRFPGAETRLHSCVMPCPGCNLVQCRSFLTLLLTFPPSKRASSGCHRANPPRQRLLAPNRRSAAVQCRRPKCALPSPNRQADRNWHGRRSVACASPDDCRPSSLALYQAPNWRAGKTSPHLTFLPALSSSLKQAASAAPHSMSSAAKRPLRRSTLAASRSSRQISTASVLRSLLRIEPSSVPSPIRA